MSVEERKLEVLRAIVEDFIATNEPVGSKALADRHNLGVSPATIRNDMASLEEEGLIAQPHTSAGRIPTDAGYRLFVDRLTEVKPLSAAEKRAIQAFLDDAVDLDDVLHRAVRTLAQLTRNVAVVQYPSLSRSKVRHLELVSLSAVAADARSHHRHRPGRAAGRRAARAGDRRGGRRPAHHAQRAAARPVRSPRRRRSITELPIQVAPELRDCCRR